MIPLLSAAQPPKTSTSGTALFFVLGGLLLTAFPAGAAMATIAVAANFRDAAGEIGAAFQSSTGHTVRFSFGSTGQLFVQIAQGAPFDAFLAADSERAAKTIAEGLGVSGSRFTYARGRIALFSIDDQLVAGPETLEGRGFSKLAIAEPASAPYGAAAVQALQALELFAKLKDRIVRGLNVAQTYQFVHTGNADLGFVALSQIARHSDGSRWIVPKRLHEPIAQDAVLLKRGQSNEAAREFLDFLRGDQSDAVRQKYGYGGAD